MNKKNEIVTASPQLPQTKGAVSLDRYDALDLSKIALSSLILIQGDNPLKKTISCDDGDFVVDNMNLGKSFDAQIVAAHKLYDVFQNDPTKNDYDQAGYLRTIKSAYDPSLEAVDPNDDYPDLYTDPLGLFYQYKMTLLLCLAGFPYKFVCKGKPKQIAGQKILTQAAKLTALNGLNDPIEGVFKFFSSDFQTKARPGIKSKIIQTFEVGWSRAATDDEIARAAMYINVDLTREKPSEVLDA
jgi:hypothetical protein